MRYVVTGDTGFIGSRVTQQLVAAGHEVVALVRDPARASWLTDLGVTLAHGDVADRATVRAPMAGADGVHLAGWYRIGARDRSPAEPANVAGTRNILEAIRELPLPASRWPREFSGR